MFKKVRASSALMLLFSFFYTLTVLPYTVKFFEDVTTLPSMDMLLGTIPLADAHRYTLPFFLAFLEFSGVFIACLFWASEKKRFILLLFLACQLLPVVSTYYEIRGRDYAIQKESMETLKAKNIKAKEDEINALKQSIENKWLEIKEMEQAGVGRLDRLRGQIATDLQNARANEFDAATYDSDTSSLMKERRSLSKMESELYAKSEARRSEIKPLEDETRTLEKNLLIYIQSLIEGLESSPQGYIAGQVFTWKSGLAAFIALIFPTTILGFTFSLVKSKERRCEKSFGHLHDHLKYAEALPHELHLEYARGLVPSISAFVAASRASGEVANNSVNLNLQYGQTLEMLGNVEALQRQILNSRLTTEAKSYLKNAVDKITVGQIFPKEEQNHA